MKANKKVVLSTAVVLGAAALVAGGTIAYFTDKTDPIINTFTVGNVEIELYESQLHRENSGIQGTVGALASDSNYCDYTQQYPGVNYNRTDAALTSMLTYNGMRYCTPNTNADNNEGISAVDNGHTRTGFNNANRTWGYSDATIIADAENDTTSDDSMTAGFDAYFAAEAGAVVPGQWIRKFSYVKNTGDSDAFVFIRYMIPTDLEEEVTLKIPGTPYEEDTDLAEGLQPYFYAVDKTGDVYSKYELTDDGKGNLVVDEYDGYIEEIGGVEYRVYAAVTREALKANEMTFWSPINTIGINTTATEADFEDYIDATTGTTNFGVIVDAQAIQAFTFADAIEAINKLQ